MLVAAIAGCSSDPGPVDSTGTSREAICSGGGGGDSCINGGGYCPPECSSCFGSASELVHLQNMWECNPWDTGGGGSSSGGSGATCSQCQSTFRTCMGNAISCLAVANCKGDFNNCADPLPSCSRPHVHDVCTGGNTE
jgi:hypothetical protein